MMASEKTVFLSNVAPFTSGSHSTPVVKKQNSTGLKVKCKILLMDFKAAVQELITGWDFRSFPSFNCLFHFLKVAQGKQ